MSNSSVLSIICCFNPNWNNVISMSTILSQLSNVVIIDNSPNIVMPEKYMDLRHFARYCKSKGNIGTAEAYNYAEKRFGRFYNYLWLWDQDTLTDSASLDNFMSQAMKIFKTNSRVAAISSRDPTNKSFIFPRGYMLCKASTTLVNLRMLRSVLLDDQPLFDKNLFMDYVDWYFFDYIYRMGFEAIEIQLMNVAHQLGESIPVILSLKLSYASSQRLYMQGLNLVYIMKSPCRKILKIYLLIRSILLPLKYIACPARFKDLLHYYRAIAKGVLRSETSFQLMDESS